jgi:aspartyl-tRNA(Asn)/glutamyl-tRNA(Gln) amidotransferase subunit A
VPVAIKDLEDTRGLRTTYGAVSHRDHVPREDSAVTARLRAAGAVIVGKTNTPAFGLLGETKNCLGEDCRNPWAPGRTTGGSSGGSAAAVAAGILPVGTGTDAAGSINCPASMCGVYGFKPSHGRVPMVPVAPDALHFNDAGPLSRTVGDAALMLSVLAGHDARDPIALRGPVPDFLAAAEGDATTLRVAWSADCGHHAVDAEVATVAERAARAFAAFGSEPVLDAPHVADPWETYMPLYIGDLQVGLGDWLHDHRDELYDETVDEIAAVSPVPMEEYVRALRRLHQTRAQVADFFERYDLLLTPSTAVAAFPVGGPPAEIGGRAVRPGWTSFMPFHIMWNMTGSPCASVPAGFTSEGLPVGLTIVGPVGRDDLVIAASAAFERARPWAGARPALAA